MFPACGLFGYVAEIVDVVTRGAATGSVTKPSSSYQLSLPILCVVPLSPACQRAAQLSFGLINCITHGTRRFM